MLNVGVVGCGYWGPNLVRNFYESGSSRVVMVSDIDPQKLQAIQTRYPTIVASQRFEDILKNPKIDAVVIATPVSTHFHIAMDALKAGKHVFLEKPLTSTSEEAVQLIREAKLRNRILMVDHTFVYTGAVRKIRELLQGDSLGNIYYFDSVRVNLGQFQHDVNVIWDLGVHDLSIMDYVLPRKPIAVSATGMTHFSGGQYDVAYLTLLFDGELIAHVHSNWLAPVKVRQTLIGCSQKMIVYDDVEPSEKVKVYDKGIKLDASGEQIHKLLVSYRSGDMWCPELDTTEALKVAVLHFIECIETQKKPITDGYAGLRVIKILEAATESMKKRGQPISLDLANTEMS